MFSAPQKDPCVLTSHTIIVSAQSLSNMRHFPGPPLVPLGLGHHIISSGSCSKHQNAPTLPSPASHFQESSSTQDPKSKTENSRMYFLGDTSPPTTEAPVVFPAHQDSPTSSGSKKLLDTKISFPVVKGNPNLKSRGIVKKTSRMIAREASAQILPPPLHSMVPVWPSSQNMDWDGSMQLYVHGFYDDVILSSSCEDHIISPHEEGGTYYGCYSRPFHGIIQD